MKITTRSAAEVARIQSILANAQPTVRRGLGHPCVKHYSPYEAQLRAQFKAGMTQTEAARILHAMGIGPAKEKVAIQYMNVFARKFMAKVG
jgi:phage terminase large subunit-like protein